MPPAAQVVPPYGGDTHGIPVQPGPDVPGQLPSPRLLVPSPLVPRPQL
jgi:hypothetical protein